jgi:pimeloyl-ACP methyl ester carboxylesterase
MRISLHFRESGAGLPLVILHGVFGSGENWFTVAKKFSEQFHVFLPDQRNHGRSPHSDAFDYPLLVEDLKDFADERGLKKFFLIGHSMGGKVAMQFAAQFPERLAGLVVVDIAPRFYPPHHEEVIAGLKAVDLENTASRTEAEAAMTKYISEGDVRQFLLKNLYRKEDGKFAWRINLPVLERQASGIGNQNNLQGPVEIPTLFVKGNNSRYIRQEDEAGILAIFPQASIVGIEGAGHWVQAEKPEEFTACVLNFLIPLSTGFA